MKTILRFLIAIAAFYTALSVLESCGPNSGGTYIPIPDERIEIFTNQNNSGKDDNYERRWRHGGSFKTGRNSIKHDIDVYLSGDELKIALPAAKKAEVLLYDETGVLINSEVFTEVQRGVKTLYKVPGQGAYRLEIVVDDISYSGIFLK